MENKKNAIKLQPGAPAPLGGSIAGKYYNFAVFFPQAKDCKLHIYQKDEQEATVTLSLFAHSEYPGVYTGQIERKQLDVLGSWGYLYETGGKKQPDPYAKKTYGRECFGMPSRLLSAIGETEFDWDGEKRPALEYQDMILYKLHVRGFTMMAPGVQHKGTYLGLAEKADYLTELGINAVLLFPCVEFDEIIEQEPAYLRVPSYAKQKSADAAKATENAKDIKVNYWGYTGKNCYFVPKASYAANPEQADIEFRQMVKKLHEKGIEVLMEMNFTPQTNPELVVECLLWWVREYHLDGFRINKDCVPEKLIALHPYLAGTKLLTAGFDTSWIYGENLPVCVNLAECNMGFAEDLRRYIKGDEEMVGRVAERMERQTKAQGVINYITDNNGFTLADLYSYDVKHNEANGEDNRDGSDYNFSWNCGVEGKTKRKKVVKLRMQMRRNALALLLLSQGTPMLLAGDEFGNSQQGNNNAYCQDNELGWVSWKEFRAGKELYEFTKMLIKLRKAHPVLHNKIALRGMDYISCGCPDSSRHGTKAWYPDYSNYSRTLAWLLCGRYALVDRLTADCSFYLAANMHWEPHEFDLPALGCGESLQFLFSTDEECTAPIEGKTYMVPARSLAVFIGVPVAEEKSQKAARKSAAEAVSRKSAEKGKKVK